MAVRTKRLAAATATVAGSPQTIYTAPAGETVILKDLRAWAGFGALTRGVISVVSGATIVAVIDEAFAGNQTRQVQGFLVLQPGDQLQVICVGSSLRVWASGAELEGVAD